MPYTNVISRADVAPLLGKDQTDMATGQEAPSVVTLRARHAAEGAAGTDFEEAIGIAPWAATVQAVRFVPDAAMTGATATATTLAVKNKTQTLTPASLAFITGTDLVAYTSKALTLGNATNIAVTAADVLTFAKTHASTGTQGPAGTIEVDLLRNDAA